MTTVTAAAPIVRELEDLIRANIPLVGHLVREMISRVPAHVNRDDLTSAGLAALVTAARGFDPTRNIPFAVFASARIRGSLLDELRGLDWASRSVRNRARRAETARHELTGALGRTPTAAELADFLGVTVSELDAVEEDVQRAVVLSLQGFTSGSAEDMVTERTPGPEDLLVHRERIGYLHDAIDALPERLKLVVRRYFLEERPMAEIAADLGVTESRVSQLRAEALGMLRDGMNSQLAPERIAGAERPEGCVARRRASYYAEVAALGTMNSRLARTSPFGVPVSVSA